jgi:hypothetical protein
MTMRSGAKPASNLNNASNKQYASLLAGQGAKKGEGPQGDGSRGAQVSPMLEALLIDLHIHALDKRSIKTR